MRIEPSGLPPAVLETSFWVAAYRAEVAANCLDLFAITVPQAVEEELLRPQSNAPQREYPYATLFRHLRPRMHSSPVDAPPALRVFGAGEAEAIVVADFLKAFLLINEHRAAAYARMRRIVVVTVPDVIVVLRRREIISDRAARRKLALIQPITAQRMIDDAEAVLDAL